MNLFDFLEEKKQDPEYAVNYDVQTQLYEVACLLASRRKAHNMTQQDIADKSGLSLENVRRIETYGEELSLEDVVRYMSALDVRLVEALSEQLKK